MHCLIVSASPQRRALWHTALEDLGEAWRCQQATDASAALALFRQQAWDVCVLCSDSEGLAVADMLLRRPPMAAPWVIGDGFSPACGDFLLTPMEAQHLPKQLTSYRQAGWIPRSGLQRHTQLTCLARGLMNALCMKRRLRAWAYLADMAALTVVQPLLLQDLTGGLYPLIARRHGMTPAAVERSLRLMIESTWSRGSLPALERFFGHSVDPERGKPTNREFLFRLHERLTLAAQRLL